MPHLKLKTNTSFKPEQKRSYKKHLKHSSAQTARQQPAENMRQGKNVVVVATVVAASCAIWQTTKATQSCS